MGRKDKFIFKVSFYSIEKKISAPSIVRGVHGVGSFTRDGVIEDKGKGGAQPQSLLWVDWAPRDGGTQIRVSEGRPRCRVHIQP